MHRTAAMYGPGRCTAEIYPSTTQKKTHATTYTPLLAHTKNKQEQWALTQQPGTLYRWLTTNSQQKRTVKVKEDTPLLMCPGTTGPTAYFIILMPVKINRTVTPAI